MTINRKLKERLASAPSMESLTPFVLTGPGGERVATAAQSLRLGLDESIIIGAGRDLRGMQLVGGAEVALGVDSLLNAQPAYSDVLVNLFDAEPAPTLEAFQSGYLETIFTGVMLLSVAEISEDRIEKIARLGASVSAAGQLLRDLLVNPGRLPAPRDPPQTGNPFVPGPPNDLLVTAERLRRTGCANAVKLAMMKWGSGVAAATPGYVSDAIDSLDPVDACPGETMTIRGSGFGDPARRAVVFTGTGNRPVIVSQASVLQWSDTEIRVPAPAAAVAGPVGILVFPIAGGESLAQLASTALGELGACFGASVTQRLNGVMARLEPPISAPPAQADGANMFSGGLPLVRHYSVSPSATLWPGRRITLDWNVGGATQLQIVTRTVSGSAHELPAVAGPLTFLRARPV